MDNYVFRVSMEVPDNVAFFKNMDKSLHNLSASLPCLGCRICSLVHKFVGYGQDDFYTDAFFFFILVLLTSTIRRQLSTALHLIVKHYENLSE